MRSKEEMLKVMNEKRMALDLVQGFVVALKHHLRGDFFHSIGLCNVPPECRFLDVIGETGVYYEDLYHLVRPLYDVRNLVSLYRGSP